MDGRRTSGRGERRERERERAMEDLGRVQNKGGGLCVLVPWFWLASRSWRGLMERHLFMGASKCNGLVQFHSGTRLSFWVGFGMAEGRETVPRCSAEDIFEERGGGGRREGFSGGILCFCMQIHHVH